MSCVVRRSEILIPFTANGIVWNADEGIHFFAGIVKSIEVSLQG